MAKQAAPRAPKEAVAEQANAAAFLERLHASASENERRKYERYFPPATRRPGDVFIGVRMGTVFELAKAFIAMPPSEIERLMESEIHEARAGALSLVAKQYQAKATTAERRQQLFDLYLRRHDRINDWDLVDLAAYHVIGPHLVERPRSQLDTLAQSADHWERRTAILATFAFIRRGEVDDTLRLAELLLGDEAEPVQKAVGWALRTVPENRLRPFLDQTAARMPRPMLRNAIEKLAPDARRHYLGLRST